MAITDLTNTTWEIPAGWTATAGYGVFDIIYNISFGNVNYNNMSKLGIGYTSSDPPFDMLDVAVSDTIQIYPELSVILYGDSITFTFTGGTDATNPNLISWLEANGTLQGGETEQTDTKPIYKRVNGAWVKLTAFERVNGAWVKISSAGETEPEQPQDPENCLTFSSPSSFTLGVVDNLKYWDGTLEYSTDGKTWTTWAGTSAISSASDGTKHNLYLRGTGNTYITGSSASSSKAHWVLTGSNISCSGNIENLLDYATVANGEHPTMATYCYSYMFYGCTSLTTAPELPATTLAGYCYRQMFYGCTSLTTVPKLPATTLATYCYYSMFNGCTQIKLSTTQTGDYQTAYRIPTSGTGTTAMIALSGMFSNTGGTFTGTPTINTTYYTSNTVIPVDGSVEEPEQPEVDDSIVGTWMWNETIDLSTSFKFYPMPEGTTYSTYNSTLYGLMTYYDSGLRTTYFYLTNADGTIGGNWLYSDKDGWQYDVYKYISFANDTDNEELRAYLKANATKV